MAQQFSNASGGPHDHGSDAARMPWLAHYPPGVDWHKQYEPAPVYALLDSAIATNSAGTCTNFLGRTMTYGDIGQMVDRAAAGLSKLGVARGAKVGLFLPNSPTFIVYYLPCSSSAPPSSTSIRFIRSKSSRSGRGQRNRNHGDARPQVAVRQGRGAASRWHVEAGRHLLVPRGCCRTSNPCSSSWSSRANWPDHVNRR